MNLKLLYQLDNRIYEKYVDESKVAKIKRSILDDVNSNNNQRKLIESFYDLYYKDIILNESMPINIYKIAPGDVVLIGKIENILRGDDIVVEVFLTGIKEEFMYLVVSKHDSISKISSILYRIIPESIKIDIYNSKGDKLNDDALLMEVNDGKDYYRIIIIDNFGRHGDSPFEDCCRIHYQYLTENFSPFGNIDTQQVNADSNFVDEITEQVKEIKIAGDNILLIMWNNKMLYESLSSMSISFRNSRFLFCLKITIRIIDILKNQLIVDKMSDLFEKFHDYLIIALRISLYNFLESSANETDNHDKLMINILNDAVKYFLDPDTNWYELDMQFLNNFRLQCPLHQKLVRQEGNSVVYITVKINENIFTLREKRSDVQTIRQIKEIISKQIGVSVDMLYSISWNDNKQPEDSDQINPKICSNIFEVVVKMDAPDQLTTIGKGSYGKVYLCKDRESLKIVALKKVQPKYLYKEIYINFQIIDCSNISGYIGLCYYKNNVCVVMEYLSKGSLLDYLENDKCFEENEISKFSYQILIQLEEIHKRGIIHRDIHPGNIVLDEHYDAKLIDFGISKRHDIFTVENSSSETSSLSEPGHVYYIAPEVLDSTKKITEKIDIWSLGVIVVHMILGNKSFYKLDKFNLSLAFDICKIKKVKFLKSNKELSIELILFLNSCLKTDPNDRESAQNLIKSKFIQNYLEETDINKKILTITQH